MSYVKIALPSPPVCENLNGLTLPPDISTLLLSFRNTQLDGSHSLSVGVVVNPGRLSPWVDALVQFLRLLPGIDVCVIAYPDRTSTARQRPSLVFEQLYSMSRKQFDPFGDLSASQTPLQSAVPIESFRYSDHGVLAWLSDSKPLNVNLTTLAAYGAFSVQLGRTKCAIPFWDEVAQNDVTSIATAYWHETSLSKGRAVREAETSTSPGIHFTQNAREPLIALMRIIANLCLELRDQGQPLLERLRALPERPTDVSGDRAYPTTLEAGKLFLKKSARSAHLRLTMRGKKARWFIAMRPNTGLSILDGSPPNLAGFRTVPLPRGTTEIADPFLWEIGERPYLFFEELAENSSRGRLGCVEILKDGSFSDMSIVLDRPYHLSYPCVVPAEGELFLLPETGDDKRVDLYRFSKFPDKLELVASPIEGLALVDTTPVFLNDRWYFFTTTMQPFMETLLFWSEKLGDPWNLHPCSPISSSVRNSRSAGNLFWKDGVLYRPTQDCSVRYGYAIQFNKIVRLTPMEFEENVVNSIQPTWQPGLLGTHTYNESTRLQVLDGIRF